MSSCAQKRQKRETCADVDGEEDRNDDLQVFAFLSESASLIALHDIASWGIPIFNVQNGYCTDRKLTLYTTKTCNSGIDSSLIIFLLT